MTERQVMVIQLSVFTLKRNQEARGSVFAFPLFFCVRHRIR
jgi:hypothetical protein